MMRFHEGVRFQRGRGLGAIFGGLFRALRPLASMGLKAGKKFIQSETGRSLTSAVKDLGSNALKNIAADALEGKNIKESAQEQIGDIKSKIAQTLRGQGRRNKRKKYPVKSMSCSKQLKYSLLD